MRTVEGAGIKTDFKKLIGNIVKALTAVVTRAPGVVADYRDKITKRVTELLECVRWKAPESKPISRNL